MMVNPKRIEDIVEKISDERSIDNIRPLSRAKLEQMNDEEKLMFVTLDNIWPNKPLEVFQEEGEDCDVALFVRALHKAMPATIIDPDHAALFYEFVTKVRDCTALVKTSEAFNRQEEKPSQFDKALIVVGILQFDSFHKEYTLNQKYEALLRHYRQGWKLDLYLANPPLLLSHSRTSFGQYAFEEAFDFNEHFETDWKFPSYWNSDQMYQFILANKPVHQAKDEKAQPPPPRPKLY